MTFNERFVKKKDMSEKIKSDSGASKVREAREDAIWIATLDLERRLAEREARIAVGELEAESAAKLRKPRKSINKIRRRH